MASRQNRTSFARLLSAAALGMLTLGLFAPAASAADTATRSYPLPDNGTLQLIVPANWQQAIQQREQGLPPTIAYTPATGEDFQVMITPVTPPRPGMPMPDLTAIRASVAKARAEAQPHAAEKPIVIHKLSAPEIAGYYFTATDKAPKPGEFRLMTQAEVRTGGIVVVMTVLSNDKHGRVRAQALAVLKSARHQAAEQSVTVNKVDAGYEITVPASTLVLTLAEPGLDRDTESMRGIASHPRYFLFRDRAHGLAVSGWFEPADSYPGLKPFWQKETEAWQQNKLPAPENVAFAKIGGWDTIAYDIKLPVANTSDVHLRAEWVQAGTWIDIHLEMTSNLPADQARAKLQDMLKQLQVRAKKQ